MMLTRQARQRGTRRTPEMIVAIDNGVMLVGDEHTVTLPISGSAATFRLSWDRAEASRFAHLLLQYLGEEPNPTKDP